MLNHDMIFFLKRFVGIIVLSLVGFMPVSQAQSADVFFPRPAFNQPGLSTDGSRVVVTDIRKSPRTQLLVLGLSGDEAPFPIDTGDLDPIFARWVGPNRLMIHAVKRGNYKVVSIEDDIEGERYTSGRYESHLIFIDGDGSNRVNVAPEKVDPWKDGISLNNFSLGVTTGEHVGFYVGDEPRFELLQININDGSTEKIARGNDSTLMMRVSDSGSKGIKVSRNKKNGNLSITTSGGVNKFSYEEYLGIDFEGFGKDGESIYLSYQRDGEDKSALYKIGPGKKIQGPLASHTKFDFYGTHSARDGRVLGGIFSGGPFEHVMFDPADQKHIKSLHKYFGAENNPLIVDASADGSIWMVYVQGPKEPGAYYIYNKSSGTVDHLLDHYAPVAPQHYSGVEVFHYTARDGTPLFGYLTSKDQVSAEAPLLILPHGGPHSHDEYGFDDIAQFFAARGYRVFQPQFRGSTGQGAAFEAAGFKQWGGRMQDDITDGVNALTASGKASEGRIAIAGISYGGYAALWGAIHQSDLYTTAIAINPASDIADQIEWFYQKYRYYKGYEENLYAEWGHPEHDAGYLKQRSPVNSIDQLKVPVLLIHGTNDKVVPIRQSRALSEAAKAANAPLEYREVKSAGHSLETDVGEYTLKGDRVDYLKELKATMITMADYLDEAFAK